MVSERSYVRTTEVLMCGCKCDYIAVIHACCPPFPGRCYLPTHTPSTSPSSRAGVKVSVSPPETPAASAVLTYLCSPSLKVSMVASVDKSVSSRFPSVCSWPAEKDPCKLSLSSSFFLCLVAAVGHECNGGEAKVN